MADAIVGKTVKEVRKMTPAESKKEGWAGISTTVVEFEDGTKIYASRDPEGSGPGALFGVNSAGDLIGFPDA